MLNRNTLQKYSFNILIFILLYREFVHYSKNNSKEKVEPKEPSGGSIQFKGEKRR